MRFWSQEFRNSDDFGVLIRSKPMISDNSFSNCYDCSVIPRQLGYRKLREVPLCERE